MQGEREKIHIIQQKGDRDTHLDGTGDGNIRSTGARQTTF